MDSTVKASVGAAMTLPRAVLLMGGMLRVCCAAFLGPGGERGLFLFLRSVFFLGFLEISCPPFSGRWWLTMINFLYFQLG